MKAEIDARNYLVVIRWSAPMLYNCSIGDSHCKEIGCFNHTRVCYLGHRQAEETVVMREINYTETTCGSDHLPDNPEIILHPENILTPSQCLVLRLVGL